MNSKSIISVSGLTYSYSNGNTILSDIGMNVEEGNIYGFLGPNGSGKTTTLSLLLGLLGQQKGTIRIFDEELSSNRIGILRNIGSLIESPSLYAHLSARENLEVYRQIYRVPSSRIGEVLGVVNLTDTAKKPVREFSLGMKQRLSLGLALLPWPRLLILDEPTNGLDPVGIIEFRAIVKRLNKEKGMAVLVSSHILSEVEKMVSHIGIISCGKMVFEGSLAQLHKLHQKQGKLLINTADNTRASQLLTTYNPVQMDECISVMYNNEQDVSTMCRLLVSADIDVYRLQPARNLEQLFIDLTSQPS